MYADDLLLVSSTCSDLRRMLRTVSLIIPRYFLTPVYPRTPIRKAKRQSKVADLAYPRAKFKDAEYRQTDRQTVRHKDLNTEIRYRHSDRNTSPGRQVPITDVAERRGHALPSLMLRSTGCTATQQVKRSPKAAQIYCITI